MLFTATLALIASTALAYPADEDRATVQEFDDVMTEWGYDYEMYKVTTEDAWELTLFRITGKAGEEAVASEKFPVLLQHGSMMDATTWLQYQGEGFQPSQLKLVDEGYDIWMGNNRGTKYSMENPSFPNADNPMSPYDYFTYNPQKYDYDWSDMGVKDLPAILDKITEVSGQDKVTYIGYSQGSTQMLYALTQSEESYFADKLNKAIFLAPCLYVSTQGLENYLEVYPTYRQKGINVVNDSQWAQDVETLCADPAAANACAEASYYAGEQQSVKSLEYYEQIAIMDRFQVYNPDFSKVENRTTELVTPGLDSIDKVDIQLVVARNDTVCTAEQAERIQTEIGGAVVKSKVIENVDHSYFYWMNSDEYVQLLADEIEYDPNPVVDSGAAQLFSMGAAAFMAAAVALF